MALIRLGERFVESRDGFFDVHLWDVGRNPEIRQERSARMGRDEIIKGLREGRSGREALKFRKRLRVVLSSESLFSSTAAAFFSGRVGRGLEASSANSAR